MLYNCESTILKDTQGDYAMTESDYEMHKERIEEEANVIKKAFSRVLNVGYYKTYIYYCLNPEKIEESVATKKAFEYGKDGAINLIRNDYPGYSDEEYEAALNEILNYEIQRFAFDPRRYDDFKKEAESITRLVEKLPPLSERKRKGT